jgi:1-acyl-sn-glycerol-3-phosphate acyltransferase
MHAKLPRKLWIMATTAYATVCISLGAIYHVYVRRDYERAYGDRIFHWYAKKIIDVTRVRYTVNDPFNLEIKPGKRYIIMVNHRSLYDIPLSVLSLPNSLRMLTKKELFRVPIWGQGLKAGEFVSIDRSDLKQAIKDLAEARRIMESGIVLWVAAEGTRSRDGKLGPFKKGGFVMAIESGATIIPVGIQGSENILRPKTFDFYLDQEVTISIGAPIEASRYTLDEKEQLMEEVRQSIASLCGEGYLVS